MWTEHTEYDEYQKLQLSPFVRYQHNNTLGKISSNYRYRQNPQNIEISFCFNIAHPYVQPIFIEIQWSLNEHKLKYPQHTTSGNSLRQKHATSDINLI